MSDAEYVNGHATRQSAYSFADVARDYLAVKQGAWGPHAESTTRSVIAKHLIGNLGGRRLDELTATEIQTFVDCIIQTGASQSLVDKAVNYLRAILDHACDSGVITRNPMRSRTTIINTRTQHQSSSDKYLTIEECHALLAVLSGLRDHLITRMFIQLGVSPKDLFALRHNDIQEDCIVVDEDLAMGQIRKLTSQTVLPRVYVPPNLMQQLHAWMETSRGHEDDWLFPDSRARASCKTGPISPRIYLRNLQSAGEKAGISDLDVLTLRRTCAAHFTKNASARDTLLQMRRSDRFTTLTSSGPAIPESLKRAAIAFEGEILRGTALAQGA